VRKLYVASGLASGCISILMMLLMLRTIRMLLMMCNISGQADHQLMMCNISGQADTGEQQQQGSERSVCSSGEKLRREVVATYRRRDVVHMGYRQRTGGEMWWQRPCLATSEKRRAFVAGAALTLATQHAPTHIH
jgi:hypothetical protein